MNKHIRDIRNKLLVFLLKLETILFILLMNELNLSIMIDFFDKRQSSITISDNIVKICQNKINFRNWTFLTILALLLAQLNL